MKCQSIFLGLNCIQSDLTSCVSLCKDAITIKVVTVKVEVAMIGMIELASVETVKVTRISWTSFLKEKEWFLLVVAGFAGETQLLLFEWLHLLEQGLRPTAQRPGSLNVSTSDPFSLEKFLHDPAILRM